MENDAPREAGLAQYNSPRGSIATLAHRQLRLFFGLLPANVPDFIYTKIVKPVPPFLYLVNRTLRALLPSEISIPEGILILNPDDPVLSGALSLGAFEKHFTELFRSQLKAGMTVIDVGANIGYYTLIAAKHVGENGRVIAFEPEPENAGFLRRMIKRNALTNVEVRTNALGDSEGEATLYLDPDNKGKHTLLPVAGNIPLPVKTRTLDAVIQELNLSSLDIIKMDIEGWEAKALKGMRETLTRYHPVLFFEFAPARVRETGEEPLATLRSLIDLGYTLREMNERSGSMMPIVDREEFVARLSKEGYDGYANIRASRNDPS